MISSHGWAYGRADPDDDAPIWANIGIPPSVWWNNFERILMAVDDLGLS